MVDNLGERDDRTKYGEALESEWNTRWIFGVKFFSAMRRTNAHGFGSNFAGMQAPGGHWPASLRARWANQGCRDKGVRRIESLVLSWPTPFALVQTKGAELDNAVEDCRNAHRPWLLSYREKVEEVACSRAFNYGVRGQPLGEESFRTLSPSAPKTGKGDDQST